MDIEQAELTFPQLRHQMSQRHFGGVVSTVKHGFAGEQPADGHAIDAARQVAFQPALDAVRVPELMQLSVGFDKGGRDPGASPRGASAAIFA